MIFLYKKFMKKKPMIQALLTFLLFFQCTYACYAQNSQTICERYSYTLRPQDPLRPYPYDEEEVLFRNVSDNVTLVGTLTLPRSAGPFPVVILLQGSAPLDRDCKSHGHKMFLVWADHLTRQGIAVLRFDKRSAGKSTGNYHSSNLENFAKDALAGIDYLKSRKDINPHQIGLIGHSEGGMTAFLAASQSQDIAFVVSMAAPCVNIEEIVHTQEPLFQRADGVPEELILQTHAIRNKIFTLLKKDVNHGATEKKLRKILTQYFNSLTPSQKELAEAYYGSLEHQLGSLNSSWFRYWLAYDPICTLKKVTVPILALNGELDLVVTPEQNLKLIGKVLEEVGHKDFTILQLPQLNHSFQTCYTGSLKEYENIEETTSPLVLNILSEWCSRKFSSKEQI
jgi:dipeptidyl aminopeptidase/acylaminoacyl peptidase